MRLYVSLPLSLFVPYWEYGSLFGGALLTDSLPSHRGVSAASGTPEFKMQRVVSWDYARMWIAQLGTVPNHLFTVLAGCQMLGCWVHCDALCDS